MGVRMKTISKAFISVSLGIFLSNVSLAAQRNCPSNEAIQQKCKEFLIPDKNGSVNIESIFDYINDTFDRCEDNDDALKTLNDFQMSARIEQRLPNFRKRLNEINLKAETESDLELALTSLQTLEFDVNLLNGRIQKAQVAQDQKQKWDEFVKNLKANISNMKTKLRVLYENSAAEDCLSDSKETIKQKASHFRWDNEKKILTGELEAFIKKFKEHAANYNLSPNNDDLNNVQVAGSRAFKVTLTEFIDEVVIKLLDDDAQ